MMKIRTLVTHTIIAGMLGFSATASAGFDFGSPFDMFENDDDNYRYGARDGRGYGDYGRNGGYGRERWRQYDEWEPNYWRYRYFDDDSQDYFFDGFDGDGFGFGDGRFDFDMNMDMDTDSRFDGRNDYRYRGDRDFPGYGYKNDGYRNEGNRNDGYRNEGNRNDAYRNEGSRNNDYRDRDYDRPAPARRAPQGNNADQYNDDYWRDYSQRYNGNERRR